MVDSRDICLHHEESGTIIGLVIEGIQTDTVDISAGLVIVISVGWTAQKSSSGRARNAATSSLITWE
jgi:hypothetical protein